MAGNYLSVIVLFDAWQDADGGAATASLIRSASAGLQGRRSSGKRGRASSRKRQKRRAEKEKRGTEIMIFMNHTNAIYL